MLESPLKAMICRKSGAFILELLRKTRHAQEAVANPATGMQSIPLQFGGMGAAIGFSVGMKEALLAALAAGGAARTFESKVVRDALIKLAGTPKGSTEFERVAREVMTALRGLAVSEITKEDAGAFY